MLHGNQRVVLALLMGLLLLGRCPEGTYVHVRVCVCPNAYK